MYYKGFTIKVREVLSGKVKREAYEVLDSYSKHILGIYKSVGNAKKAINTNGGRWLSLQKTAF